MEDNGMAIGDLVREVGIELVITLRDYGGIGGCNIRFGSVDSADCNLSDVARASSCFSGRIVGDTMGGLGVARLISFAIV